ncbi:YqjD family protein [Sulfitobacter sp. SK011]|uniref:DUF883 family protein n=1 Tax=Sulfitobacter sp. SK011 TaxID=1389004 RepID=UPI000E0C7559|nr:DUF883 family protein [Sulfitobacter sp. SK011]AXI40548.1 DUF883 domain-containing protein [Sulfitobacter sp. SK011]
MVSTKAANRDSKSAHDVTVGDLSDQIAVLKNDIAALTNTLGAYGKAKSEEASRTAKETVDDLTTAGRVKALEAQQQAEEFIRTQPATALGIAAGIGFLVGLITARR